ncbi:hypothetical protein Tco_0260969 [Tanacetum coccineum]
MPEPRKTSFDFEFNDKKTSSKWLITQAEISSGQRSSPDTFLNTQSDSPTHNHIAHARMIGEITVEMLMLGISPIGIYLMKIDSQETGDKSTSIVDPTGHMFAHTTSATSSFNHPQLIVIQPTPQSPNDAL